MSHLNIVVGKYRKSGLKRSDIEKAVEAVFNETGKEKDINIAFVPANGIWEANQFYRFKNHPTDVLAFDYGDEGDLLLCLEWIEILKESDENLAEATLITIIHGVLHLLGFDHETEKDRAIMRRLEEKIFIKVIPAFEQRPLKDKKTK